MKIKVPLLAGFGLLLCLAGLTFIYFLSENSKNHFFVLPVDSASPRLTVNRIEEFNENYFLLTYEILLPERVSLPYGEFPVTLIGTTSSYAQIMGFALLEGSFFSKQSWNGRLRHAILNENAAISIFGSTNIINNRIQIRGDIWIINGVIQDNNDKARIYIPSSIRGGDVDTVGLISSASFDEATITTTLRRLGIHDGSFNFINFNTRNSLFLERIWVILLLFFSLLSLSCFRPLIIFFRKQYNFLKQDLNQLYLRELIQKNKKPVIKAIIVLFSLIMIPIISLFLLLQMVSIILPWQDIPPISTGNQEIFSFHLSRISMLETASFSIFILSIVILCIFLFSLNRLFMKVSRQ